MRARRLAAALRAGELDIAVQPIVCLAHGGVHGAEALARWPRGGCGPEEFIGLAERSGLIVELGRQVTTRAADAAARLAARLPGRPGGTGLPARSAGTGLSARSAGTGLPARPAAPPVVPVAVNLSPAQLRDTSFPVFVAELLAQRGLPGFALAFELTECAEIADLDQAAELLAGLQALGCQVGLDDVGQGCSALPRLARLPLDFLKLDRSLLVTLGTPSGATVVRGVLGMAGELALAVIVEGVETSRQAAALLRLGCRWGQGYLYGRPGPLGLLGEACASARPGPPAAEVFTVGA